MLNALKPNESIYDVNKLYKKIRKIKIKKHEKKIKNEISLPKLPKLNNYKILEKNLEKSISIITSKNSMKFFDLNFLNDKSNFNNIYSSPKYILSDNNNKIKLPKMDNKICFSENNSPKKSVEKKDCNYLYLKYEGNNNIEIKRQIYIKIFPHKVIHSIKKIFNNNKNTIINYLEKNIKTKIDKYTTTSNLNNYLTTDYKTIEIDFNEIIKSEENKYILLTENRQTNNNKLFKIKNIFLENIIQNVIRHTIEIRNEKNKFILKGDIENEFIKQINLLRDFFVEEINNKKNKNIKKIKTKKNILKTYNKIIDINYDENNNYIDSILNKKNEGYLTERNGNIEIFNIFKNKLNLINNKSLHNLYYNIINNKNNNISKIENKFQNKKISTDNNNKDNSKKNNNKIYNFYENYIKIKDDLNINKEKNLKNKEYIFELSPNIKLVEFNEVFDEIDNINKNKKNNNKKNINNEKLLFLMLSDDKLNFKNFRNKNYLKIFNKNKKEKIKRKNTEIKTKKDIIKLIGDKLHKKINLKIGRNKKNNTIYSQRTEYSKSRSESNSYNSFLTVNRYIYSETNSSVYSDIPSDLSISYTQLKKEKEEKSKKIRQLLENIDNYNLDEINNIYDIDELFLKQKKKEENNNEDDNINKKELKKNENINDKIEIKKEENIDDKLPNKSDENKISRKNVNIIKNKFINKSIKNFQIKDEKDKVKPKYPNIIRKSINNQNSSNTINNIINKKDSNLDLNNKKDKTNSIKKGISIKEDKEDSEKKIINNKKIKEAKETKEEKVTKISINKKNKNIKKRKRRYFNDFEEDTYETEKNVSSESENNFEEGKGKITYEKLMLLFIDKYNIPGKNNKIKIYIKKYCTKQKKEMNETYINNKNKKKKLKRKNTFSFINTRNDRKLILLKPILRHILFKKNSNIKKIKETINRIFNVSQSNMLDMYLNDDIDNKEIKKGKKIISLDYHGNFENSKKHNNLLEKFFGSKTKVDNYYQDDIDLLLDLKYGIKRKPFKKRKVENKRGFKDFLNDDNFQNIGQNSDYFENCKKENDKIRDMIEKQRKKKIKKLKESEDKLRNFRSYINNLKNMTEEKLRFDTIRFIYKIKPDQSNIDLLNRAKRISDFKNFIKKNEILKLDNTKSILKDIFFQHNCTFFTDKLVKI